MTRASLHRNPSASECEATDCDDDAGYHVDREGSADLCGKHASDVKNGYASIAELTE